MLTLFGYKISMREKILLGVLVLVLVGIGFYQFVYVPLSSRASQAKQEAVAAQDMVTASQLKVERMERMQETIDELKRSGAGTKTMPSYDNIKNVMSLLNTTVGTFQDFDVVFQDLEAASDTVVRRGADITFSCDSYEQARSVVNSLQQGPYLCTVDSLSFRDKDVTKSGSGFVGSSSTTSSGTYAATAHVTFYERIKADDVLPVSDSSSKSK